jgi:seryl-tRNA synthetase
MKDRAQSPRIAQLEKLYETTSKQYNQINSALSDQKLREQKLVAQLTEAKRLAEKTEELQKRHDDLLAAHIQVRTSLRSIADLHVPGHDEGGKTVCEECHRLWPCPTKRAIQVPLFGIITSLQSIESELNNNE